MNVPLISLIIPMYNAEKYIEQCISSIKSQIYQNLEVIIINDGCKDNTLEFCVKYINNDARFKIYSTDNCGAASARNYGLRKSNGEYIVFADADDYFYPDYISYLFELISRYHADMACCGCYKMWDTEKIPNFDSDNLHEIVFNRTTALEDYFYRKHIRPYPYLKLYKKQVIENVVFPTNVKYGEDAIFTFKALQGCSKVVYGSKVLYIYYQHSGSIMHNYINCMEVQESWKCHMEVLQLINEHEKEIISAAYSKYFILAIDFSCRLRKDKSNGMLKKDLLEYIKNADGIVLKDKKCKTFNRLLAALSCISPKMMIRLCGLYTDMKNLLKFETRQSV